METLLTEPERKLYSSAARVFICIFRQQIQLNVITRPGTTKNETSEMCAQWWMHQCLWRQHIVKKSSRIGQGTTEAGYSCSIIDSSDDKLVLKGLDSRPTTV